METKYVESDGINEFNIIAKNQTVNKFSNNTISDFFSRLLMR